jgi:DnaJ-class molecular chaperone
MKVDIHLVPTSFRSQCGCCDGAGNHDGCSILSRRECEACDGTGWMLNKLGADLLSFLIVSGVIPEGRIKEDVDALAHRET